MEEKEKEDDEDDVVFLGGNNLVQKLTAEEKRNLRQVFSPAVKRKTRKLLDKALALCRKEGAPTLPLFDGDENDFSDFKQESHLRLAKPTVQVKSSKRGKLTMRKTKVKSENGKDELISTSSEGMTWANACQRSTSLREKHSSNENVEETADGHDFSRKKCHICNEELSQTSLKLHLQNCMKARFEHHKKGSGDEAKSNEKLECPVCSKDLGLFCLMARSEHINKCIDQAENKDSWDDEEYSKLLQNARNAVMGCPMCGKKLQTVDSRTKHLKQCAILNKMSVEQVRNLIDQQREEYHNQLDAGVLPQDFRIPTKQAKPKGTRKPLKFTEDIQIAMALSTSVQEFQPQEKNNRFAIQKNPAKSEGGKKSKQEKSKSLLLSLTKEEANERISNQVASLMFNKSSQDELSKTPSFKHKKAFKSDSLWLKTSIQTLSEDEQSLAATSSSSTPFSSSSSSPLEYYVNALMPTVSISTVVPGSKLRRCSEIPGRGKSLGQADFQGTETTNLERSKTLSTNKLITSAPSGEFPPSQSKSPNHHLTSQTQLHSDISHSQTVGILALLAHEHENHDDENDNGDDKFCRDISPGQSEKEEDEFDLAEKNKTNDHEISPKENLPSQTKSHQDDSPPGIEISDDGTISSFKSVLSSRASRDLDEFDLAEKLEKHSIGDGDMNCKENLLSQSERDKAVEYEIQDDNLMPKQRERNQDINSTGQEVKFISNANGDYILSCNEYSCSPERSNEIDLTHENKIGIGNQPKTIGMRDTLLQIQLDKDSDEDVLEQNSEVNDGENKEEFFASVKKTACLSDGDFHEIDCDDCWSGNKEALDTKDFGNNLKVQADNSKSERFTLLESLSSCLLSLVDNPIFSDVSIRVKQAGSIDAHKNILLARCPQLLDMCIEEERRSVIHLPDFDKDSVLWILNYIYGGKMDTQTCWKWKDEIMQLATKLCLNPILERMKRISVELMETESNDDPLLDCEMDTVSAFSAKNNLNDVDSRNSLIDTNNHNPGAEKTMNGGPEESPKDSVVDENIEKMFDCSKAVQIDSESETFVDDSNESIELFSSENITLPSNGNGLEYNDADNENNGLGSQQVSICKKGEVEDIPEMDENTDNKATDDSRNEVKVEGTELDVSASHFTDHVLNTTDDDIRMCIEFEENENGDPHVDFRDMNKDNSNVSHKVDTINASSSVKLFHSSIDAVDEKGEINNLKDSNAQMKEINNMVDKTPSHQREPDSAMEDSDILINVNSEDCTHTTPVSMELTANVTSITPKNKRKRVSKKEFNDIIHAVSTKDGMDDEEYSRILVKLEQVDKQYGQKDLNDSLYIPSVLHDATCLDSGDIEITNAFFAPVRFKKRKRDSPHLLESCPKKRRTTSKFSTQSTAYGNVTSPAPSSSNDTHRGLDEDRCTGPVVNQECSEKDGNGSVKSTVVQSHQEGPSLNGSGLLFDSDQDLFSSGDEGPPVSKENLSKNGEKCDSSVTEKEHSIEKKNILTNIPKRSLSLDPHGNKNNTSFLHATVDCSSGKRLSEKQLATVNAVNETPKAKVHNSHLRSVEKSNASTNDLLLNKSKSCVSETFSLNMKHSEEKKTNKNNNLRNVGHSAPIPIDSFTDGMVSFLDQRQVISPQSSKAVSHLYSSKFASPKSGSSPSSTMKYKRKASPIWSYNPLNKSHSHPDPAVRTENKSSKLSDGSSSSLITDGSLKTRRQDSSVAKVLNPVSMDSFTEGMVSCLTYKHSSLQDNNTSSTEISSSPKLVSPTVSSNLQSKVPSRSISRLNETSHSDRMISVSKSCLEMNRISKISSSSSSPPPSSAGVGVSFSPLLKPSPPKKSTDVRFGMLTSPNTKKNMNNASSPEKTNHSSSPLSLRERLGLANPFGPKIKDKYSEISLESAGTFNALPRASSKKVSRTEFLKESTRLNDDVSKNVSMTKQSDVPPEHRAERKRANPCSQLKKKDKIPSPFTPMAPYDDMNTPELKKAVGKVGVRPMGKKRMRDLLKHIYKETHCYETDTDNVDTPLRHPVPNSPHKEALEVREHSKKQLFTKLSAKRSNQDAGSSSHTSKTLKDNSKKSKASTKIIEGVTKGQGFSKPLALATIRDEQADEEEDILSSQDSSFSDGPDVPEESMLQVLPEEDDMPCTQLTQTSLETLNDRLMAFLNDNPKIYEQILMYEALELDVLKKQIADAGIRIGFSKLQDFLDERCITFSMKNMSNRNNRQRPQKKRKGNSPTKRKKVTKSKECEK